MLRVELQPHFIECQLIYTNGKRMTPCLHERDVRTRGVSSKRATKLLEMQNPTENQSLSLVTIPGKTPYVEVLGKGKWRGDQTLHGLSRVGNG